MLERIFFISSMQLVERHTDKFTVVICATNLSPVHVSKYRSSETSQKKTNKQQQMPCYVLFPKSECDFGDIRNNFTSMMILRDSIWETKKKKKMCMTLWNNVSTFLLRKTAFAMFAWVDQ